MDLHVKTTLSTSTLQKLQIDEDCKRGQPALIPFSLPFQALAYIYHTYIIHVYRHRHSTIHGDRQQVFCPSLVFSFFFHFFLPIFPTSSLTERGERRGLEDSRDTDTI